MLDRNKAVKQIQAGNALYVFKCSGPYSKISVFAVRQSDVWYVVSPHPRTTRPASIPIDTPVNLPDMLVKPCIVGWKPVPQQTVLEKSDKTDDIPAARPWNRTTRNQKIVRFLMRRDGDKCVYCQAEMHLPVYKKEPVATLDHLVPRSKGGTDDITNMVLACLTCNQMKADTLPDEFMRRIWGQYLERCPHDIRM